MISTIIIGSGGHAKVIVDILNSSREYTVIGFTDPHRKGTIMNLPILGDDSILNELLDKGVSHAFVALGDNRIRLQIGKRVRDMGYHLINAISPDAFLSDSVRIGVGVAIMPGVIVNAETTISDLSILNTGATIDHDCTIGKSSHIAPGCHLAGCVSIAEGVFLGVGTNIIPEICIGEWTIIGAGSTVINNISSYSIAVGVPAKIIKGA